MCWVPLAGRDADAFWRFEARLRGAILPLEGQGEQDVFQRALSLWITKRLYDRLAASADDDRRMRLALGVEPMPASYRMRVRRPGLTVPDWWVTVSISIAWRRGIGHFQQFATELADGFAAGRLPDRRTRRLPPLPSLHTRLVLTTLGHPHSDGADERRGAAKFDSGRDVHKPRTKPESDRKQRNCKNQPRDDGAKTGVRAFHITSQGYDGFSVPKPEPSSQTHREAAGQPGPADWRTKPEFPRKYATWKNVLRIRSWTCRAISGLRWPFAGRSEGTGEKNTVLTPDWNFAGPNATSYDPSGRVRLQEETG
jgi:hypothetical protein